MNEIAFDCRGCGAWASVVADAAKEVGLAYRFPGHQLVAVEMKELVDLKHLMDALYKHSGGVALNFENPRKSEEYLNLGFKEITLQMLKD